MKKQSNKQTNRGHWTKKNCSNLKMTTSRKSKGMPCMRCLWKSPSGIVFCCQLTSAIWAALFLFLSLFGETSLGQRKLRQWGIARDFACLVGDSTELRAYGQDVCFDTAHVRLLHDTAAAQASPDLIQPSQGVSCGPTSAVQTEQCQWSPIDKTMVRCLQP